MEADKINLDMQKGFFNPFCSRDEIERIFNVQNADDYLLKVRAETIVDHMRLFRVYRNRALRHKGKWSLEQSFVNIHYKNFLNALDKDLKERCELITAGNIFSTEPNGFAFSTEFGPVITICDSLQYFLKFMHLGLFNGSGIVPEHVCFNSMTIAVRVMLQTEALDFLMDPRGIIPEYISKSIHEPIPYQMQFIAGHEYAHHLLGHVPADSGHKQPVMRAMFKSQDDYGFEKVYSYAQKNEFEADVSSIMLGNYSDIEKKKIFEAALIWFACLEIYEMVSDTISPPMRIPNHPPARERYQNLLDTIKMPARYNYTRWNNLVKVVDKYKKRFAEDIGFNFEKYEFYGSVYFDAPDTKWRGKELIDRVDYY